MAETNWKNIEKVINKNIKIGGDFKKIEKAYRTLNPSDKAEFEGKYFNASTKYNSINI